MAVVASVASPTLSSFDALSPPPSAICIAWPVGPSRDPLRIDLVADSSGRGTRLVVNGLHQATVVTIRGASVAFDLSSRPAIIDRSVDALVGWTVTVEAARIGAFVGVVGWAPPPGPVERCCCH